MTKLGFTLATLIAFVALNLLAAEAFAEDASKKFQRGALNTTTGWTELPLQMASQSSSENLYHGLTYGFVDGLTLGTKRTLYGAWDWLTFGLPPYDKPKMSPETVFGETP